MAADSLRAAGIDAALADAETVSMDWLLSNAIGGIKVQVREEDAERAVAELGRRFGEDGEGFGADDEEPEVEEDDRPTPPEPGDEPDPPAAPVSRDDYARRLVLAAVFGLVIPLLWFYAVYLFLNAAFGEGSLTEYGRNKLFVGTFVLALGFPVVLILLTLFGIV
jgi:hypothetical protein